MKKSMKLVLIGFILIISLTACKNEMAKTKNKNINVVNNGQLSFAGTSEDILNKTSQKTYSDRFPADTEIVNHIFLMI